MPLFKLIKADNGTATLSAPNYCAVVYPTTNATSSYYAQILVQGKLLDALIDSGSSITLLNIDIYNKFDNKEPIDEYRQRVLTANNSPMSIIGRINFTVQLDKFTTVAFSTN